MIFSLEDEAIEPIPGTLADRGVGPVPARPTSPEERILVAVIVQAITDAPKENRDGMTARAFLGDPQVHGLIDATWGVATTSRLNPGRVKAAIQAYRLREGKLLMRKRWRDEA